MFILAKMNIGQLNLTSIFGSCIQDLCNSFVNWKILAHYFMFPVMLTSGFWIVFAEDGNPEPYKEPSFIVSFGIVVMPLCQMSSSYSVELCVSEFVWLL